MPPETSTPAPAHQYTMVHISLDGSAVTKFTPGTATECFAHLPRVIPAAPATEQSIRTLYAQDDGRGFGGSWSVFGWFGTIVLAPHIS